jgi:hypothetical protein
MAHQSVLLYLLFCSALLCSAPVQLFPQQPISLLPACSAPGADEGKQAAGAKGITEDRLPVGQLPGQEGVEGGVAEPSSPVPQLPAQHWHIGGATGKLLLYTPMLARSAKGPWARHQGNPVCMVDSGATANFVSKGFLRSLPGTDNRVPDLVPLQVKLANGTVIKRQGTAALLYIKFQYYVMPVICSIIPLAEYDVVLGMPRLQRENLELIGSQAHKRMAAT